MTNGTSTSMWRGYVPIAGWLPDYDRSWLAPDSIAALTVWALLVPTIGAAVDDFRSGAGETDN